MNLKESAGVSFSLSFLIQVLTAIVLGVWAYSQFDARISTLENDSVSAAAQITRIEETMDQAQDAPITADYTQNERLAGHARDLLEIRTRLMELERRLYEIREEL